MEACYEHLAHAPTIPASCPIARAQAFLALTPPGVPPGVMPQRLKRFTANRSARYASAANTRQLVEIGVLECKWAFISGEKVVLETEGCAPDSFVVFVVA